MVDHRHVGQVNAGDKLGLPKEQLSLRSPGLDRATAAGLVGPQFGAYEK